MQPFVKGVDPREYVPKHRERGAARYSYTYQDLIEMLQVSESTVKKYKPNSLEVLARFIHRQEVRLRSVRLTREEIEAFFRRDCWDLWENRWPRFDLWWCGDCQSEVLLAKGLCTKCGGGYPAMSLSPKGYFSYRIDGKLVEMHKFLIEKSKGVVHHKDGNKWNNRLANLEVMDMLEHLRLHGSRFRSDSNEPL
jgi:hypothetical protein